MNDQVDDPFAGPNEQGGMGSSTLPRTSFSRSHMMEFRQMFQSMEHSVTITVSNLQNQVTTLLERVDGLEERMEIFFQSSSFEDNQSSISRTRKRRNPPELQALSVLEYDQSASVQA